MKTKIRNIFYALIVIVLISNISKIPEWIDLFVGVNYYAYSNADGTFTAFYNKRINGSFQIPKHLSTIEIDAMQDDHMGTLKIKRIPIGISLRNEFPNADTTVYRIFMKNPLTFWRWRYYIIGDEKYDFPYKNWREIKAIRNEHKLKENSSFQEF